MLKHFPRCLLLSVFIICTGFSVAQQQTTSSRPYENDKIYLGFGFGARLVDDQVFQTAIAENKFIPDDSLKLSEQLVLGYDFTPYLGLEGQFTFFPNTVYSLTPNNDSIIRKIYAFSGLVKIMLPVGRVRVYFGGGGSIVYTLAPNFEIHVPDGIYAPPDFSNYIAGKWGHKNFFRPEIFVGLGYSISQRILISVIYSQIFGTGEFEAHPETFAARDAEFFVNKNYLPNLKLVVLMVTMKI